MTEMTSDMTKAQYNDEARYITKVLQKSMEGNSNELCKCRAHYGNSM